MKTPAAFLAAITALFYISESRAFSIKPQNEDQLDVGESSITRMSGDEDLTHGLDAENLALIKENVENDLHDVRKRDAPSERRSNKREESSAEKKEEHYRKALVKGISHLLEPMKDKISQFMKPVLDRIKHKPKIPSHNISLIYPYNSDSSTSSDSTTSSVSSTPSVSATSSTPVPYPPSSKCSSNERHRNMETMSLLFPNMASNSDGEPFVFVPFTNTLIRVAERELIKESQNQEDKEEDSKAKF